uniref:AAA+ ATPase domain-containing protein n=1 Tax=viral metagenome TaxID=1070528 RepID=A0A6C0BWA1_9ZZZZ
MQQKQGPWVEKYRPDQFEKIVLDDINHDILTNIITQNDFPNLLFYGQPGTGKTTTIINLIKEYQKKATGSEDSKMMIHLNASDDRGIDIIRSQINNFVSSKPLFNTGIKFIILDEADYMTKTAQQALHILIEQGKNDVRFCLICNYISKIDLSLQNEFIHMRFNILPKDKILEFLKTIIVNEKLKLDDEILKHIININNNDIRSMINYIQVNQEKIQHVKVITNTLYQNIDNILKNEGYGMQEKVNKITALSSKYYCKPEFIIKKFLGYKIFIERKYDDKLIKYCNMIMHHKYTNMMLNRICTLYI